MKITVAVVYALADVQQVIPLELAPGTTIADAVAVSGILQRCPELDPSRLRIGVWGRRVDPHAPVRNLDRIEIYRPLPVDPKLARRDRANAGRKTKRGPYR
jgi:uncharacterized protein